MEKSTGVCSHMQGRRLSSEPSVAPRYARSAPDPSSLPGLPQQRRWTGTNGDYSAVPGRADDEGDAFARSLPATRVGDNEHVVAAPSRPPTRMAAPRSQFRATPRPTAALPVVAAPPRFASSRARIPGGFPLRRLGDATLLSFASSGEARYERSVRPWLAVPHGREPDDPVLEADARRKADQVLGMTSGRRSSSARSSGVRPNRRSGGRPLDVETRDFMEARFGSDFSDVRVHTDPAAAESARAIGAEAYAFGSNIVFRSGQLPQATPDGRHLLAHELAHVAQQQADGRPRLARSDGSGSTPAGTAAARAVGDYVETPLEGGRVELHAWGRVGDPIRRPGLEKKYPLPKDVGLSGCDRWHLAGPDATGTELGIAYAPKNFNVSKTATVENVLRRARDAALEHGGEVFFDFKATVRIIGQHEGVDIRVLEEVTWAIDVRAAGSEKIIPILRDHGAPAPIPSPLRRLTPSSQATSIPSPRAGAASEPAPEPRATAVPSPPPTPQPTPSPAPSTPAPTPDTRSASARASGRSANAPSTSTGPATAARQTVAEPVGTRIARSVRATGGTLVRIGAAVIWNYLMSRLERAIEQKITERIIAQRLEAAAPTIQSWLNGQVRAIADLQIRESTKPVYANIEIQTVIHRYPGEDEEVIGIELAPLSVVVSRDKIDPARQQFERVWTRGGEAVPAPGELAILPTAPNDVIRTTYSVALEPLPKEQLRSVLMEELAEEEAVSSSRTAEQVLASEKRRDQLAAELQHVETPR